MSSILVVERPKRWEVPFDTATTDADVERLLRERPFHRMDVARFPRTTPLTGILKNDARIVRAAHGEVLIREGDYGNSAFLVLKGTVRVVLRNLPQRVLGRAEPQTKSWWEAALAVWQDPLYPEVRGRRQAQTPGLEGKPARIFLQDIPTILGPDDTTTIGAGEVFGELAALSRTPRTATVLAEGDVELLEIRWQGLRDILRSDPAWREHVDQLYRENSLRVHLRETPLLRRLSPEALERVAASATFASFGDFDWHKSFRKAEQEEDVARRIEHEPIIAREGDYPDGLLLIRNGFARLSVACGDGHRTLAYLGKGDVFGLDELVAGAAAQGWKASLRAIGYVDVIRIPTAVAEACIVPTITVDVPLMSQTATARLPESVPAASPAVDTGLLEFLVDHRYGNATEAMVIDLDRCTRCDDCVKACAATHDGNPRFFREGPRYGRFQFAHACMQCVDPVCMIGCPTGAIARDPETGVVVINDDTCIGCTVCAQSCPYDNIRMVGVQSADGLSLLGENNLPVLKATKCDMCAGMPGGPACQNACGHEALVRIDLRDPSTLVAWRSP